MKRIRMNPGHRTGNATLPIILILAALTISALVFIFYTRPKMQEHRDAEAAQSSDPSKPVLHKPEPDSAKPTPASGDASTAPMPKPAMTPNTAGPPSPTPAPAATQPMPLGFSKPGEVGDKLARALNSGDAALAAHILSGGQASQEISARSLIENLSKMGFKVAPPEQVQVLGQVEGMTHLSIPLLDAKTNAPSGSRLTLEIERDEKMGYKVARVRVPKAVEAATAAPMVAASTTPSTGATPPPAVVPPAMKQLVVVEQAPNALSYASDFVRALLHLDYEAARKLVNEQKVPAMKLAALCIIFEDSHFQLLESQPLVVTVNAENSSWIIAHIHSDLLKEDTEFGLEMEQADGRWRVGGLNLSKMLADNAKSSSVVGIPYTPLVLNPKGGESIALYFELDQATLHPRAQKQLDVIATVLKSASHKKLKITGHTDALGSDRYNIALSQGRALAVKEYMLAHGVPVDQVETVGLGKAVPLSPNQKPDGSDDPEGRSHNRRAEILLDF